jgi:predicted pyridoxine 5'-phosphate oxidase superfamily flavin-nucleotide-binding protein
MNQGAIKLGQELRYVFVATADGTGSPHLAVAGEIAQLSDEVLTVSAWFCPGTIENLEQNRRVSIVIWSPSVDAGYQLVGEAEEMQMESMMNGYTPEVEKKGPIPQVKWKLRMRVEKTIHFTRAPHSDIEE